jgi:hypothetical protein
MIDERNKKNRKKPLCKMLIEMAGNGRAMSISKVTFFTYYLS